MNAKALSIGVGLVTLVLGAVALLHPQRMLDFAGFAVAPTASVAQATAEIRALYGGFFIVLGLWIVFAALREARLFLVAAGTMFLGAALGRVMGGYLEGNPGIWGWVAGMIEVGFGFVLTTSAWLIGRQGERWPGLTPMETSSPTATASVSTSQSNPPSQTVGTPPLETR